ncbi:MAG TPA: hypothetical protein VF997_01130, partial [Polyangia bacterium]
MRSARSINEGGTRSSARAGAEDDTATIEKTVINQVAARRSSVLACDPVKNALHIDAPPANRETYRHERGEVACARRKILFAERLTVRMFSLT